MVIFNIRGINGSGKTTVVKRLLSKYGTEEVIVNNKGKILAHKLVCSSNVFCIGSYVEGLQSAGCDTIKDMNMVFDLLRQFNKCGHIVAEGVYVSSMITRSIDLANECGNVTFCFMDTPLDVCVERIKQRNGNKPFKADIVYSKGQQFLNNIGKFKDLGLDVVVLNFQDAPEQFEQLLISRGVL